MMPIKYMFLCNCYSRDLYIGALEFTMGDFWHFWLSNLLSKKFSIFQVFSQPYHLPYSALLRHSSISYTLSTTTCHRTQYFKFALVFLSAISRHTPFHLFTTLSLPTKEPFYILTTPLGRSDCIKWNSFIFILLEDMESSIGNQDTLVHAYI